MAKILKKCIIYIYKVFCRIFRHRKKRKIENDLIYHDNDIQIDKDDKKHVSIHITGKNNTVLIKKLANANKGKIEIYLRGDNNKIIINEGLHINSKLTITMGKIHANFGPIKNSTVTIGKDISIGSAVIVTYNSNANIQIGDYCMMAFNVFLFHTDAHPIIEKTTGRIINQVKNLIIGKHVWIGGNVSILKNTNIPNDSILGLGSVVSGNYCEKGTGNTGYIIAGNPAKILKEGITWNSNGSNGYIQNDIQEFVL